MTMIEDLKKEYIEKKSDIKDFYDQEEQRLKTAVKVMELRGQYHLSQRNLAEKAGVPQSTIARIENGSVNTSVGMLGKIANAVDKELEVKFI
ncbi:MAG TPA: helix-turn-helix domain-containing protein [Candidatus Salinicoccus merdavium]|nr:helix-turn-helix domain-containing protein [Candidatus Salinicoccus merdavium]